MIRQVFLFTNHLLVTNRSSNGRLHLAKNIGKVNLAECTLVEDTTSETFGNEEGLLDSPGHHGSEIGNQRTVDYKGLDFRLIIESKTNGPLESIIFLASTIQEKAAWCSDISQCIDQLHYTDLLNYSLSETSAVSMPHSIRADPKLFRDDEEIKFSRTLNSCKVPQIRHATVNRLLERLVDLRFLSIDFLNTFLLTYRIFTTAQNVILILKEVLENPEICGIPNQQTAEIFNSTESEAELFVQSGKRPSCTLQLIKPQIDKIRRISTGMMKTEMTGEPGAPVPVATDITPGTGRRSSRYTLLPHKSATPTGKPHRRAGSLDYNTASRETSPTTQQPRIPSRTNRRASLAHALSARIVDKSAQTQEITVDKTRIRIMPIVSVTDAESEETSEIVDEMIQKPPIISVEIHQPPAEAEFVHQANTEITHSPPGFSHCTFSDKLSFGKPIEKKDDSFTKEKMTPKVSILKPCRIGLSRKNQRLAPIASCEILSDEISKSSLSDDEEEPLKRRQLQGPLDDKPQAKSWLNAFQDKDKKGFVDKPLPGFEGSISYQNLAEYQYFNTKMDTLRTMLMDPSDKNHASSVPNSPVARRKLASSGFKPHAALESSGFTPPVAPSTSMKSINKAIPGVKTTKFDVEPIIIPEAKILDHKTLSPLSTSKQKGSFSRQVEKLSSPSGTSVSQLPVREADMISPISPPPSPKKSTGKSPFSLKSAFLKATSSSLEKEKSNNDTSGQSSTATRPSITLPPTQSTPSTIPDRLKSTNYPMISITPQTPSQNTTSTSTARCSITSFQDYERRASLLFVNNHPRASVVSWSGYSNLNKNKQKRPSAISCPDPETLVSPRSSVVQSTLDSSPQIMGASMGAVVTSSRSSRRRSSNAMAMHAFAAATAGSANPGDFPRAPGGNRPFTMESIRASNLEFRRHAVLVAAATMRVLNVVKHWMSKFPEDFDKNPELKTSMRSILEDLVCSQNLLPSEHRAAAQLLRQIMSDRLSEEKVDLEILLVPTMVPSLDNFDSLSALDIAEQMTYLDHHIFRAIESEELLNQAWMKSTKYDIAKNVLLVSKRFNEQSRLVVSEIIRRKDMTERVACIEKWVAIADICRCIHNYNGVLQICAALVNSSIYRLRRTWDCVSKSTSLTIDRLQTLVSSDSRFKNMREALHRCDPPCIPYLGMYLSDLSFIEEGSLNLIDTNLINFCKMRMVSHVSREIQQYQQTPYRIDHRPRITDYLLDTSRILDEEETYTTSLCMEPRQSISRQN